MDSLDAATERAFRIIGRVQGVGFRWWTQRMAVGLGLRGCVRNLPDGSVEVQAAGSAADLAHLEQALADGPPGARVDRVEAVEPDPRMLRDRFRIES